MKFCDLPKGFALLVAAGVVVLVMMAHSEVMAGTEPRLYIRPYVNPTELHLSPGEMATIDVSEDSGTMAVDAVAATVTYPTDKLELTNINTQGSAFDVPGEQKLAPGNVQLVRGRSGTPLVGAQHIANLTFVVRVPGVAVVGFAPGSMLADSAHGVNISPILNSFPIPIEGQSIPSVTPVAAQVDGVSRTVYPAPSETPPGWTASAAVELPTTGMTAMGVFGLGVMSAAGLMYVRSRRGPR